MPPIVDGELEQKPATETSSCASESEETAEKPVSRNVNENRDMDADEAEWMDIGHQHDLESQKSRVSYVDASLFSPISKL